MRRWIVLSGVVSLVLSLVASVLEASAAGESFRSGNRATREEAPTYRTPPSDDGPSAPEADPPRTKRPKKPPSWKSMVRGLLTGGLIGSIFFGRSFGGVGLLEVVILSGLIVLAFWALSRYQLQPSSRGYATAGGPAGGVAVLPPRSPGAPATAEDSRDALERGIEQIRQADPSFDSAALAVAVGDIFQRIQAAWTARDIRQVADVLTLPMRDRLEREVERLRAARRINRVERITVRRVSVVGARQERGWDHVTVQIVASLIDYTTNEMGLKVLEGNPFEPVPFSERWRLVRPSGSHPWQVDEIE